MAPRRIVRGVLAYRGLTMDTYRHLATLDGMPLDLTPTEFLLLFTLLVHPGWVLSRVQLADVLYNGASIGRERSVDSHIKNLRKKCRAIRPDGVVIRTVYSVGYACEG